jgi:hypothetical protein
MQYDQQSLDPGDCGAYPESWQGEEKPLLLPKASNWLTGTEKPLLLPKASNWLTGTENPRVGGSNPPPGMLNT